MGSTISSIRAALSCAPFVGLAVSEIGYSQALMEFKPIRALTAAEYMGKLNQKILVAEKLQTYCKYGMVSSLTTIISLVALAAINAFPLNPIGLFVSAVCGIKFCYDFYRTTDKLLVALVSLKKVQAPLSF